ncbi:MAG TPA: efflux RND transporter permease subunit, partial [Phenylobacterium sp.]|nr:efflux RND transporter permease subunit [Phenylobacterium sp.]
MVSAIVRQALRFPQVAIVACILLLACGGLAAADLKADLLPQVSPAFATVETEAPGLGAEQVEQLVTRNVENALLGTHGVADVHSTSIPGRSIVDLRFQTGARALNVRQAVADRLAQVVAGLPQGVAAPRLSPSVAGGGDVLKIGFTSGRLSPMALRTAVQWGVRPQLLSVPGVAEVEVYGGELRRIEVRARAGDLSDSDLGYADVFDAVRRATGVAGAGFIDTPVQRVLVDPHGQALTANDVAAGQIQVVGSAPTRISDVADVVDAPTPPVGDALIQGRPAVLIRIRAQFGANTLETTRAIEARLAVLRPSLQAQGIDVDATLDRPASFISTALGDLMRDLAISAGLVAILLALVLRDWRGALAAMITIPLSFAVALMVIRAFGWTLNVMTVGGLVVALGLVVDDAVIAMDHILTRLRDAEFHNGSRAEALLRATIEVRQPVVYAAGLIVVVIGPVFLLRGTAGALLAPLAAAVIAATLGSLLVALVATPVLALLLLGHVGADREPPFLHRLKVAYDALLARIMAIRPVWVCLACGLLVLISGIGFSAFRLEFLPPLHSGHLTAELRGPASTSITAMQAYGGRIARDLLAIPQVRTVSQLTGRAETGSDASGPEHALFDIDLRPGLSDAAQEAVERRTRALLDRFRGFHADVGPRPDGDLAGPSPRGAVEVGIYGQDLDALDAAAAQVAAALAGAGRIAAPASAAAPSVRIDLNFQRLAIYGLSAADVLDTVQTAFEGRRAAQVYDAGGPVDIVVTAQAGLRQDPEGAGELLLRSSSGVSAPLKSVANVYLSETRGAIEHDGGVRHRSLVAESLGDAGKFIRQARARIASSVVLPPGVYLDFVAANSGEFGAVDFLAGIGLAAGAMLVLLWLAFGSMRAGVLVLGSVAFSFVGGVTVVALTGGTLSLGAMAGFVTLFGIAARAAILLISQIETLMAAHARPWTSETVRLAARQRLWPILISALLVSTALSPL